MTENILSKIIQCARFIFLKKLKDFIIYIFLFDICFNPFDFTLLTYALHDWKQLAVDLKSF